MESFHSHFTNASTRIAIELHRYLYLTILKSVKRNRVECPRKLNLNVGNIKIKILHNLTICETLDGGMSSWSLGA